MRIYARHTEDESRPVTERATAMLAEEQAKGVDNMDTYTDYGEQVEATKRNLLEFLINARRDGKTVAGYGGSAEMALAMEN